MRPLLLLAFVGCEPFDALELQPDPVLWQEPPRPLDSTLRPSDCDQDGDGALRGDSECLLLDGPRDCDDDDPAIHPAAREICDGRDDDCDGTIDGPDPVDAPTWYADADGDGYGDDHTAWTACEVVGLGLSDVGGDCDDRDAATWPGAPEVCGDLVDQDCDGVDGELTDLGLACAWSVLEGPGGTFAGSLLAGTGDVDGDGLSDLAVTAPFDSDGRSRLYSGPVQPGASPSPLATLVSTTGEPVSGSVAGLGDLDGDGLADLAVGQLSSDMPSPEAAWLFTGRAQPGDVLAASGVLFGPELLDATIRGVVVDGTPGALVVSEDLDSAWLLTDLADDTLLLEGAASCFVAGSDLAGFGDKADVGDLDGDGLPELVLGAPDTFQGAGAVLVVPVAAGTLVVERSDAVLRGHTAAALGSSLVLAGDLDGDGLDDLVVGSPEETVAGTPLSGAVRILRGGSLEEGPTATFYGTSGERLGAALLAPGNLTPDLDDGADLVVSSGADGTLFWFPRTEAGGMALPERLGPEGLGGAGLTLAAAGDLDDDGLGDLLIGLPTEDEVHILVAAQF